MNFLINAAKVIFLLGFLVFIHEGGHFLAAKFFRVKVEEFSLGFGKKVFSKQGGETLYSIRCIPFGGYVKMTGENEKSEEEGSFSKAKLSHRIAIVAAGAIVNIIFAIIVYFILSLSSEYNVSTTVSELLPEAIESSVPIEVGDKILKIDNTKIRIKSDIEKALREYTGGELKVLVQRNNENVELKVKPIEYENSGRYVLGIQVALLDVSFNEKVYYAFWETVDFLEQIGVSLKMLFTGNVGIDQMTGPIGISEIVVKTNGIYNFIYLLCLISLSLGVTNLLPIPALDGGRLVLLIIEGIRGKALDQEVELSIQSAGFFLLILFSIYISYKDILRIF